jgi:hypothetical protein
VSVGLRLAAKPNAVRLGAGGGSERGQNANKSLLQAHFPAGAEFLNYALTMSGCFTKAHSNPKCEVSRQRLTQCNRRRGERMGEAKRRREAAADTDPGTIYHHSSILMTNRIWMDGVLKPDGPGTDIIEHPKLEAGIKLGAREKLRRACQDFPPLVWFTTRILIPKCMMDGELVVQFQDGPPSEGVLREVFSELETAMQNISTADCMNFQMWNRIALGFPIADTPITRWRDYHGYDTLEGRSVNESAIEAGDNPDDWYVSETPVDVMKATEVWTSRSIMTPKLERSPQYLAQVHRMVALCRAIPNTYIPPTWLDPDDAKRMMGKVCPGVPVVEA